MSDSDDIKPQKITQKEEREVQELVHPRAAMLYEVVRQEGQLELERTFGALWWSGIAAGLSMGFSILLMAVLENLIAEDSMGGALIKPLGYSAGFLIVVLARQQLFTENTITAILPLMSNKTRQNLYRTTRLWAIVLAANLVGTFLFAIFMAYSGAASQDVLAAARDIGLHLMDKSTSEMFFGAILAGWLVASMVWVTPATEGMEFWVVIFFTYVIALLGASHIIAGSVEAYLLVLHGDISLGYAAWHFAIPTFLGNVAGGTTLFAMISYVQVRGEIPDEKS